MDFRKISFPAYFLFFFLCQCSITSPPNKPNLECEKTRKSVFADTVPDLDMSAYNIQETMQKEWYANPVNYDQGFNPFFVPFDYHCKGGNSDPMQRLTFPVLLSLKFDFVDNNISTRHPAFVYSRDAETQKLSINDTEQVTRKMEKWGQNVAVGGVLYQDGTKYSGTLKIINKEQTLFEKQFSNLGYFELMGKMVISWIEFSDGHVSDDLNSELIKPMTKSNQALVFLGQTFNLKERSDEMWKMYEKILEIDPNFAEVRWWYANQKWWQTKDKKFDSLMMLTALESHIVVPALREVEYSGSQDNTIRYNKIFSHAKALMPAHWVINSLEYAEKWDKMDRDEALKLSESAIKTPYAYTFSNKVASKCFRNHDYQVSIPLMLSIINSGYNPGTGNIAEFQRLVYSYHILGHLRDSAVLINPMFQNAKDKETAALYAGYVMDEALDFKKAIEMFKIAAKSNYGVAVEFLVNAYLDAGMTNEVRNLKNSDNWNVISDQLKLVFEGRLNYQECKPEKAKQLLKTAEESIKTNDFRRRFLETALLEIGLAEGNPEVTRIVNRLWANSPRSRKTYHLFKKVYEKDKRKICNYLYVSTHIFPQETFWHKEALKYQSYSESEEDQTMIVTEKYNKGLTLKGIDKIAGFENEYICLKLVKSDPAKYYNKITESYRIFTYFDKHLSSSQESHRKAFLSLLENYRKKQ